jgi:hypothetical protein
MRAAVAAGAVTSAGSAAANPGNIRFVGDISEAQALPAPGTTATVRQLLKAYAGTLDAVDALPVIPMAASRWHWRPGPGRPGAPVRLPRVPWMLRSLTLWHIDRVLLAAEQALRRRSALGNAEEGDDEALHAVTEFRVSLPSPSKALRFSALAVAALVVSILLLRVAPHHVKAGIPLSAKINQLLDTLSTLQLSASSLDQVIDALLKASVSVLAASAAILSLAVYVILWPVASAFRLKRMLLNLYPDAAGKLASTQASWSVTRAEGAYALEGEVLARLGARVPSEPPLDLLVPVWVPAWWIIFWVWVITALGIVAGLTLALGVGAFALLFMLPPAAIRLAWLAAAWRARTGRPRSTWLFGDEVRVPWRDTPVRCRSPLLIGWLSLTILLYWPLLVAGWVWWSTARDLRDLGREYGLDRARNLSGLLWRIPPWAQALAPFFLLYVAFLVMPFFAVHQVREAQLAAGLRRPVARSIAWLAFIWPVQFALLQRELNRLWRREATCAASHPAAGPVPVPGGARAGAPPEGGYRPVPT